MSYPTELNDEWAFQEGRTPVQGDAQTIDLLLKTKLIKVDQSDWAVLYRHRDTQDLWDLTYPRSELHGGGPRRLRRLDHRDVDKWEPYPES